MALTGALRLLLGGSYFSVTQQFLQRASGMPGQRRHLYDQLIRGLWQDGTWGLLDCLYILAAPDAATARLNLVSTDYSLIANGTTTFTPDQGFAGDGSTGYLDTQFNPSTATSPNFTLSNCSFGAYDRTSSATVCTSAIIMGNKNIWQNYMLVLSTGPVFGSECNAAHFPAGTFNSNRQGAWIVNRDPVAGATTMTVYKNGSSTAFASSSGNASGSSSINAKFALLAQGSASPSGFTTDQLAAAFIGGGLTGAQAAAINNRINAYMTALGANIY
jgi:hypothetical protein